MLLNGHLANPPPPQLSTWFMNGPKGVLLSTPPPPPTPYYRTPEPGVQTLHHFFRKELGNRRFEKLILTGHEKYCTIV